MPLVATYSLGQMWSQMTDLTSLPFPPFLPSLLIHIWKKQDLRSNRSNKNQEPLSCL